jgi:nicotinate-nucleotide pyrophosphorylase (carboxylating)
VEKLDQEDVRKLVRMALDEDSRLGDVTTLATVPADARSQASMLVRESAVIAGLDLAVAAFRELDPQAKINLRCADGQSVDAKSVLLEITGRTQALLTAERVALNFVQRLSGVATLTSKFVELIKGTRAKILDTRKTTPGLRRIEKYAVACGGGQNHRFGLFDMVLIKDNHLAALRESRPNAIAAAISCAREQYPKLSIEVEADRIEQVEQAVKAGADIILLDNMSLEDLRKSVALVGERAKTEASGGVTLGTVRAIAETGVDFISVGALTHSARAIDIGLDFESL